MRDAVHIETFTRGALLPTAPLAECEEAPTSTHADPWAQAASHHLRAIDDSGAIVAVCSLWAMHPDALDPAALADRAPMLHAGRRYGAIGHFWCAREEASTAVLRSACDLLRSAGCELAVGPLDGSTWRRYRFVTESSDEPPFMMEPTNPSAWPTWWRRAGFVTFATYHSALAESVLPERKLADDDNTLRAVTRARGAGLSLRSIDTGALDPASLDPGALDGEFRRIHRLSCEAFADNLLYTPIGEDEFSSMYRPLLARLDPQCLLVADDPNAPGELAGFIMSVPNVGSNAIASRAPNWRVDASGHPVRTLILKSMAVRRSWRSTGLGTWLIGEAMRRGRELGMDRAIFALMHDDNHSARIARHGAHVIRRYALLARDLTSGSNGSRGSRGSRAE